MPQSNLTHMDTSSTTTFTSSLMWPSKSRRSCRPSCTISFSVYIISARHLLCEKRWKPRHYQSMIPKQPRRSPGKQPTLNLQSQRKWWKRRKINTISDQVQVPIDQAQSKTKQNKIKKKNADWRVSKRYVMKHACSCWSKTWLLIKCWINEWLY